LLIGNIVSPLQLPLGAISCLTSHGGSSEEANTGPYGSTGTWVARSGADCRTYRCPDHRADHRTIGAVLISGFAWRCSSYLLLSPLPAQAIISHEYLERLSRTRQHHDARACWHGCASTYHRRDKE
jgi:hypothetical protein